MKDDRCWGCCQENCGYSRCSCSCHGKIGTTQSKEIKQMSIRPKFQTTIEIPDSNWINNIQYDPSTEILDANLKSGKRYRYYNVTPFVFASVVTSRSSGKAFNDLVKGHYTSKTLPRKKSGFYLTGR